MKEGNKIIEEEYSERSSKEDDEDLLYTHKSENRDGTMQWNSILCKRPRH